MTKHFARVFVVAAALALAACGQSTAPPTAQNTGELATDIVHTLTPSEQANLTTALQQLPEGAQVAHIVPDGNFVVLHYVVDYHATADFITLDAAHALTGRNQIDFNINPERQVEGVSRTVPAAADQATEEANKAAVIGFYTALNTSPATAAQNFLVPEFTDHTLQFNRDAWVEHMTAMHFELAPQQVAAWNDIVAVYVTVGARQGSQRIYSPGYDFFRFQDGKIVEQWRLNY